ncbi:hypothetical protein [Microbispora rosea]|uniref:hypothetical protein n=1 Tax=Microbispora rosea TaxID=58117 RepID=UPI00343D7C92
MTWLHWHGEDDFGYWAESVLRPTSDPSAYASAAYYWHDPKNDTEESDRVLAVELDHHQADEVELHAALVVAAVRVHGARKLIEQGGESRRPSGEAP